MAKYSCIAMQLRNKIRMRLEHSRCKRKLDLVEIIVNIVDHTATETDTYHSQFL